MRSPSDYVYDSKPTSVRPVPILSRNLPAEETVYQSLVVSSIAMDAKKQPEGTGGADARYTLHQGDAVDWLRSLATASIDLMITDPPYESLEKYRAVGTTTRLKRSKASSNDWFAIFPNQRFPEFFAEVHRVLRSNRHFYLFCDAETMFIAKPLGEAAGFRFWKPLVWDKQKIGMGYHYRARYEFILFFEKGRRRLKNLGIPDVLSASRIRGGYPTEKPVEICSILVSQSTEPGEVVVDPFAGSGAVGVAAVQQGRRFWGNDTASDSIDLMRQRLQAIA